LGAREGTRVGHDEQVPVEPFRALAGSLDAPLDELALSLAAEFRPVDAERALDHLDRLAAEVDPNAIGARGEVEAVVAVLGERHGFRGDRRRYDDPANSMLDLVLERRRGLPILLSVVYVEVARRAGIPLAAVGLPGHFVCGHMGAPQPLLLDPFDGGRALESVARMDLVRPWTAHETVLRILNNLVAGYERRADLAHAIRAAELRLLVVAQEPEEAAGHERDLLRLRARLN
jgi:regulator of sirC expression with transglutaminase-like and TPR domain